MSATRSALRIPKVTDQMMLFWRRVRNSIGRTSLPHCRGRTPTLSCATSSARNATGTTSENGVTSTAENGVVSRPESRVQVRQTTKQVVVQGFGFTTDHKAVPSRRLHQSPPQSQQMCCFHARRPTCYGKRGGFNRRERGDFQARKPRAG